MCFGDFKKSLEAPGLDPIQKGVQLYHCTRSGSTPEVAAIVCTIIVSCH